MNSSSEKCDSKNQSISYMPAGMDEDDDDYEYDLVSPSIEQNVQKTCKNMKITILPDISKNAGLNDEPFDVKLDSSIEEWLEKFKKVFTIYKKSPIISSTLQEFFNTLNNPYCEVLKILANCATSDYAKNSSLAFKIMEELSSYKSLHAAECKNYIDDNLKMVAFNLIKNHGQQPMKLIANSFNLIESKHLFIEKIKEFIERHLYKDACQIAYELELFNEFTLYDFIFPLFLQDKYTTAEEYLAKAVHLQKPFIVLLDSLLDRSGTVFNNCGIYIMKYDYTDVKHGKLHTKPLTKLITRLSKKFDIPQELAPNVNKKKNYGALQFLIHKKYVERSLNNDSWEEMVKETVPDDVEDLQIDLIFGCSDHRDYEESLKWAKYFNIAEDRLPSNVRLYIEESRHKVEGCSSTEENWDNDYYKESHNDLKDMEIIHTLALDDSKTILINNKELFDRMLNNLKNQPIVAFDSEWKPTFAQTTEVALIQLATRQNIYLIDVITLKLDNLSWNNLGKYVFNNDEILKIAFAPTTDISMFEKTIPSLNLEAHAIHSLSYLDLQEFWRKLATIKQFRFPYTCDNSSETLSNLVKKCLGKKLDKSNQFSNWAKRPLRQDQLNYAALDAYCLLEIYDVIEIELNKIGINFNEFLLKFLNENRTKLCVRKKEKLQTKSSGSSHKIKLSEPEPISERNIVDPIQVYQIQFVTDTMLEGLGKALRKCGIDTVMLKHNDDHDTCIKLAFEERCILTKGSMYERYIKYLPGTHLCMTVKAEHVDDQLIEVLRHFNIQVSEENIFSRCLVCNCNEYLRILSDDLLNLKKNQYYERDYKRDYLEAASTSITNKRSWILTDASERNFRTGLTNMGVQIKFVDVSINVLNSINEFYVCQGCGKCYWDGTHYTNEVTRSLKNILTINKNKES